jgi:hypothetical protein
MVTHHHHLEITGQTSATDVISFLRQAQFQESEGRKFTVRAVEKTHTAPDGKPYTVKILFVRSGRETPFEWFSNLWNRKQQYALASRVLSYGLTDMPRYRGPVPKSVDQSKDLRVPIFQAGLKHRSKGVPVSIFKDLFARNSS